MVCTLPGTLLRSRHRQQKIFVQMGLRCRSTWSRCSLLSDECGHPLEDQLRDWEDLCLDLPDEWRQCQGHLKMCSRKRGCVLNCFRLITSHWRKMSIIEYTVHMHCAVCLNNAFSCHSALSATFCALRGSLSGVSTVSTVDIREPWRWGFPASQHLFSKTELELLASTSYSSKLASYRLIT